eukprot:9971763-Lingulodinium_polyedra.AAC.1
MTGGVRPRRPPGTWNKPDSTNNLSSSKHTCLTETHLAAGHMAENRVAISRAPNEYSTNGASSTSSFWLRTNNAGPCSTKSSTRWANNHPKFALL